MNRRGLLGEEEWKRRRGILEEKSIDQMGLKRRV
jgi:hypothetical protein